MTTDTIADMLTRIRNANQRFHPNLTMPSSKIKVKIAAILKHEGYIQSFRVEQSGVKKTLIINLKYKGKRQSITGLKRISKPGLRVYASANEVPKVLNGLGIAIISTSQGVLSDTEAREKKLGGEVIAYVW